MLEMEMEKKKQKYIYYLLSSKNYCNKKYQPIMPQKKVSPKGRKELGTSCI
jgi:hypothetical protein